MRRAQSYGSVAHPLGFPVGRSPIPITHVSASSPFHPGRSDFPSPVGDLGFPLHAFPTPARLNFTPDVRRAAKSAVGAADIAQSDTLVQPLQATSEMESAQALLDATFRAPNIGTTILTAQRGFFSTALLPDAPLILT